MKAVRTLEEVYQHLQDSATLQTKLPFIHKNKTNGRTKNMSLGRIWINLIFPDDFPLIDEPVDKKKLKQLCKQLYDKYDNVTVTKTLDTLKREAFKLATIQPVSYSIDDLVLPPHIEEKRQQLLNDKSLSGEELFQKGMELTYEYIDWLKENDAGTYTILTSGAKGSPELICSLMIVRSSSVDIENEVSEPIRHSLVDGYDIKEYFDASKTARRAFYIVAKGTAKPGELARNMVFANSAIVITIEDCKTKKYLELDVTDNKIASSIVGRFYIDNNNRLKEITSENVQKLIGKTIKLRSPIYCKAPGNGICKICYGKLAEKLDSKYIGILAANAINKATVEGYSMKAKHSLGIVKASEVDFTKDIIQI